MNLVIRMWDDAYAATVTASVLTILFSAFSLDRPHWERKFTINAKEHEIRSTLIQRYYRNRPRNLYSLVPHLALRTPIERRRDRFRLRAERAAALPEPLRSEAVLAARAWIGTVGALAEEAARSRADLRPFLGTYHLGVIREGVIAVPIAMSMMARRELTAEEEDRLGWGLALVELAATYNSRARQQRRPIYFTNTGHEAPIGPVLRAPGKGRRRLYDLMELFERPLRLPRLGRRRWGRWLRTIDVEIPDRRPAGRT